MTDKKDPDGKEGMEIDDGVYATGERKVTWHYTRKKNLKSPSGEPRYESEEVGIFITDLVPDSEPNILVWANKVSADVMAVAKTEVWSALDLDFTMDKDGVPELDPELPVVPQVNAMRTLTPPQAVGQGQPSVTPPTGQPAAQGVPKVPGFPAPQPPFCKSCGHKDFYDNVAEVEARLIEGKKIGPDWACKGCGKGVFRANSYDYNAAVGKVIVNP